jgi:signal transduction histidine kinase
MIFRKVIKSPIFIITLLAIISVYSTFSATENSELTDNSLVLINAELDSCWKYRTKNPSHALEFGLNALKQIDNKKLISLKPKALNYLGIVYRKLGNLDKSYDYYKLALNLANVLKDSVQIGYTYNNLTDYYLRKASYTIALENVLISYQIFEKLNNKVGIAYSLNYLGEIYIQHGDFEKALYYLEKASQLRLQLAHLRGYSKTLTNMGIIYFKQKDFTKAEGHYVQAMVINTEIGYKKGNSRVLSLMSDINYENKQFDIALNQAKESLEIDYEIKNKSGIISNHNKLGLIYLELKNYSTAKKSFETALSLANESGHLDLEMQSYLYLSKYYSAINENKKGLEYLKKYISIKEEIYSNENMGQFADLQTLFATKQKEIENTLLKNQIEFKTRNNQFLFAFFIVTLIIILLLISKYKTQNKANNLLKELNSSKDKFFSILAHDLKNPFQVLIGYTDLLQDSFEEFSKDEIKTAITSINSVSHNVYKLLEGLLEWSRAQTGRMEYTPTQFKLSVEANSVLELYSQNSTSKGISLVSKIDESINLFADKNMINTILRNLVSNGIKFTKRGDSVSILSECSVNEIKIIVEDTGIGMSEKVVDSLFRIDIHHTTLGTEGEIGTGVGLMLCSELVKLHKGSIWVESKLGRGSKFIFTIPISIKGFN